MARLMADAGPGNASRILSVVPGVNIIAASPGWSQRDWSQFPTSIARLRYTHDPADYSADILDVEPAYAQPSDVPTWLAERQRRGLPPGTVYANVSRIGQVRQAAAGMPFFWWASNQTGQPHEVPGAVATQYYGSRQAGWQGVDVSVVSDPAWPGGGSISGGGGMPASVSAAPMAGAAPAMPTPPGGGATVPYLNPLRGLQGITAERIDMGVDYGGSGPVYALGPGVITSILNPGWGPPAGVAPGAFIAERLTAGPLAGRYVYVAEGVQPAVQVGQQVDATTIIGHATGGGLETGFAEPPGTGFALARHEFTGNNPTSIGAAYANILQKLGAPTPGVSATVKPTGSNPSWLDQILSGLPGWLAAGAGVGGIAGGGLFGDIASAISGLFAPLTEIGHFFGVLVTDLTDVHMYISLGWLALGMALLILGIYLWVRTSDTYAQAEGVVKSAATAAV